MNSQVQIFEIGEYNNDCRIGRWNYIYKDVKMNLFFKLFSGGGYYNKNGEKQGKWIQLDEGFYYGKQVTNQGEYNMNGMKVGRWDIIYYNGDDKEYKQMEMHINKQWKWIVQSNRKWEKDWKVGRIV
ncbi:unnamed protein product [Paramecium sonneborni]|uniref:MORN repeat protein n=1 Tax=Paramecium sonneborni TaxID=65129 RepID=A0A8S1RRD2_9CILI|nr:unnamed protein product [Paramecium sonneborni]